MISFDERGGVGGRQVKKTVLLKTINSSGLRTISIRVYIQSAPRCLTWPLELLSKNEKGRILTGTPGIPFSWSIQNLHFFLHFYSMNCIMRKVLYSNCFPWKASLPHLFQASRDSVSFSVPSPHRPCSLPDDYEYYNIFSTLN